MLQENIYVMWNTQYLEGFIQMDGNRFRHVIIMYFNLKSSCSVRCKVRLEENSASKMR